MTVPRRRLGCVAAHVARSAVRKRQAQTDELRHCHGGVAHLATSATTQSAGRRHLLVVLPHRSETPKTRRRKELRRASFIRLAQAALSATPRSLPPRPGCKHGRRARRSGTTTGAAVRRVREDYGIIKSRIPTRPTAAEGRPTGTRGGFKQSAAAGSAAGAVRSVAPRRQVLEIVLLAVLKRRASAGRGSLLSKKLRLRPRDSDVRQMPVGYALHRHANCRGV